MSQNKNESVATDLSKAPPLEPASKKGDKKGKSKKKTVISVVLDILLYAFFALCIFGLVVSVTAKRDPDGAVSFFGKQMRVVISPSMAACPETDVSEFEIKDIPVKSLIFIDLVPEDDAEAEAWYDTIQVGDVLTFRYVYVSQETITHRVTAITPKPTGGYIIELEGDNKASDANTLTQTIDTSDKESYNYIIGRVTGQNYPLGLLISALKSPIGIVCMVIVPAFIIMILEIIRLVGALGAKKRAAEDEANRQRDEELEALKRQLAQLQNEEPADEVGEEIAVPKAPEVASPDPAKKSAAKKAPAKKPEPEVAPVSPAAPIASTDLRAAILAYLAATAGPVTIGDMQSAVPACAGLSNQKIMYEIRGLMEEGKVVRSEIKGKAHFAAAVEPEPTPRDLPVAILEELSRAVAPMTVSEMLAAIPECAGLSNQKVLHEVRQLIAAGKVERTEVKGKAYFAAKVD